MRAFIVTTEYQLINSIRIINAEGIQHDSDIYLLEKDDRLSSKINNDYLCNKVNNVVIKKFKPHKLPIIKLLYVTKSLLVQFFKQANRKYDCVYIAGTEVYSKVLAYGILNQTGKLFFFEDGIESYDVVLDKKTKAIKDLPFSLICRSNPLQRCCAMYVYAPECIYTNSYNTPIKKLINYDFAGESISLADVFIEKPYYYDKKIIFFGAWFTSEIEYKYQDYLINLIAELLGKDNVCIKKHPNDEKMKNSISDIEYITTKSSFEVSNSFQDMNDKVLISAISTACITPRMINQQEPHIVYLYKLFEKKFSLWVDVNETIIRLLSLYNDKSRILIPENEEELINGLKEMKGLLQ